MNNDAPCLAATAGPFAASAASLAETAANSSRGRGAAACIGWSGAPAGASSKAVWVASSGGRSDWDADPTGVASSGKVCGGSGSATAEASRFKGCSAGAAGGGGSSSGGASPSGGWSSEGEEEEEEEVDDGEQSIPCWIHAASATAVSAASATAVSCGVSSGRQKKRRVCFCYASGF